MEDYFKPKVVLIPDCIQWVLGTWAQEIAHWHANKYDFIIFPYGEIEDNEKLFLSILTSADAVHCLTQFGFPRVRTLLKHNDFSSVRTICNINHIVKFSQIESCLSADRILVMCQKYREELLSHGIPKNKIILSYYGIDAKFFSPVDKAKARAVLGIQDSNFTIGFSAKASSDHDRRKGIDLFLKAIAAYASDAECRTNLIVTGPGWADLLESERLPKVDVRYFPFLPREKMPYFYNSLDIYLVTARAEGGPVPLFEAMSCGTAVVTTPVGMAIDFVRGGINGLIIAEEDAASAARALKFIQANKEIAAKIAAAARDTVLMHLQWQKTIVGIDELYKSKLKHAGLGVLRNNELPGGCLSGFNKWLADRDRVRWERNFLAHKP